MAPATSIAIAGSEPVYRIRAVADHLGVSTDTVYALVSSGKLRSLKVGRCLRVPQSAVDEFIRSGSKAS